jgi:hypothetical protein
MATPPLTIDDFVEAVFVAEGRDSRLDPFAGDRRR